MKAEVRERSLCALQGRLSQSLQWLGCGAGEMSSAGRVTNLFVAAFLFSLPGAWDRSVDREMSKNTKNGEGEIEIAKTFVYFCSHSCVLSRGNDKIICIVPELFIPTSVTCIYQSFMLK